MGVPLRAFGGRVVGDATAPGQQVFPFVLPEGQGIELEGAVPAVQEVFPGIKGVEFDCRKRGGGFDHGFSCPEVL